MVAKMNWTGYTTILRLTRHVHRFKVEECFDSVQNEIVTRLPSCAHGSNFVSKRRIIN